MKVDVAVIGAGTTGAAAAWLCARSGLEVACLDARPLSEAGARWVNSLPGWMFDEIGLARPRGEELRGDAVPFHVIAGWSGPKVVATGMDLLDVDMRALVARLQDLGAEAGVRFLAGRRALALEDGRLQTDGAPIEAEWVVDASGLGGAGLISRPRPRPDDLCVAAQQVRRCTDRGAAEAFYRGLDVVPGQVACFTGIAGGYSIVNNRLEEDEIAILTGSIPALGHPSGRVLLDRFAASHPWIGEPVFGGSRALPLRLPYLRLGEGRVALIGDAACQVFAVHGSGIGAGLVAAKVLADALAAGEGVWGYNLRWQRRWGGLFAGAERLARFSRRVSALHLGRLIRAGLVGPRQVADGLDQVPPTVRLRELPATLLGVVREPRLVARMLPVLAVAPHLARAFADYPDAPEDVAAWARKHRRLGIRDDSAPR